MAKLIRPILFSKHFGVPKHELDSWGLFDPILNSDTLLFIDPLLLSSSNSKIIAEDAFNKLKIKFSEIVSLLAASKSRNDVAWRNAAKRLDLHERSETCLGYGGASTSGSSRPDALKHRVLDTTKEIITLGETDPQVISLMGIFEEGIGPDTISDLTTNLILDQICQLTNNFCKKYKIKTSVFNKYGGIQLPINPFNKGLPILLVPTDILRELPLASDWSDISRVVSEIEDIRDRFNNFLGPITQTTVSERKKALKLAVLNSLKDFRIFFQEIIASSDNYDQNDDILNFFAMRQLLASDLKQFSGKITKEREPSKDELKRIVKEIIIHFKTLVEKNNMWEMLWTQDKKPKRERASQLLFFAIADVFCRANNIDISPETNSGGGPVDFKFSKGYDNRIVVEMKRSTGTVVHGYKTQINVYKEAASTDESIFIIMDVGGMGTKLADIKKYQKFLLEKGEKAPHIEVIDARPKISASKRE